MIKVKKNFLVILLFLISLLFLTVSFSTFFYYKYVIVDIQNINASVIVGEDMWVGINKDTDAFYFGGGPRGSIMKRVFNVTNDYSFPIKIVISSKGNFSDWIILEKNNFVLEPGELETIFIETHIPENATLGEYKSNLKFVFIRKWL